jgi:hypothetical protein
MPATLRTLIINPVSKLVPILVSVSALVYAPTVLKPDLSIARWSNAGDQTSMEVPEQREAIRFE